MVGEPGELELRHQGQVPPAEAQDAGCAGEITEARLAAAEHHVRDQSLTERERVGGELAGRVDVVVVLHEV